MEFLNDLSYLKSKQSHDKILADASRRKAEQ